jgi:hypothetical protein
MPEIPTYAYAFAFAVIAAVAGRLLGGRGDEPGSLPGWILYAVAAGCAVIGLALVFMDQMA